MTTEAADRSFPEQPVLDSRKIMDLEAAMGPGPLNDVLRLVPDSARAELVRVDGALASGDLEAARRAAHALKGFAANLGLNRLSLAAAQLDLVLRNRDADSARPCRDALDRAMADTEAALARRG